MNTEFIRANYRSAIAGVIAYLLILACGAPKVVRYELIRRAYRLLEEYVADVYPMPVADMEGTKDWIRVDEETWEILTLLEHSDRVQFEPNKTDLLQEALTKLEDLTMKRQREFETIDEEDN